MKRACGTPASPTSASRRSSRPGPAHRSDGDRKGTQAADHELGAADRGAGEREAGEAAHQGGERDLQLDPGQRGAQAEVDAGAEAEVRASGPAGAEPVRVEPADVEPVGV